MEDFQIRTHSEMERALDRVMAFQRRRGAFLQQHEIDETNAMAVEAATLISAIDVLRWAIGKQNAFDDALEHMDAPESCH